MTEKLFNTRILLKYDSLDNWNSSELILKAGEVAIAAVPVEGAAASPVVIKVGDGSRKFRELEMVSGLAADVHEWAKLDADQFKTWLDKTAGFATDDEVSKIKAALEAKDAALQSAIDLLAGTGGGSGSQGGLAEVYVRVTELETVLSSFLPEGDATATLDAVKNAIDAVDAKIGVRSSEGVEASGVYADIEALEESVEGIEAANLAMSSSLEAIQKELSGEGLEEGQIGIKEQISNAQSDIDEIEEKIGTVAEGKTVAGLITEAETAAKQHATDLVAGINSTIGTLEPRVKANEDAIALLNNGAEVEGSVANTVAVEVAKVVANAPEDFNTLKEVADWIANDTTGAAAMQTDIAGLKTTTSTLSSSVASLVAKDTEIEGDITALEQRIDGITGESGTLTLLAGKVDDNAEAIEAINEKIGSVTEGKTLAELISANAAAISGVSGTVGSHTTLLEGLRTDLNAEIDRAKAAEKVNADAIAAEVTRATKAEEVLTGAINGLKAVAKTGMINDLSQKDDEELIFDCGNAGVSASV